MIRIGMLSFWHVHARDYVRQATQHPDTQIVAVWDEVPERGQAEAKAREAKFFNRLEDLLAQPEIDAVVVDTPTVNHRDIMLAAARAGKHIFTEKVLAPTLRECNEIVAAVEKAGVKLTVSLPRLYHGYTHAIKQILDEGQLGQITLIRTRLSHNGAIRTPESPEGWLVGHFFNRAETVGGAMIDLGCHPMYLARLFGGFPESVSATYGYVTGREVEDNAVAVLNYPDGALAVAEAGFVNRFSPFTIEVHGTEGSLLYGTPEAQLLVKSAKLGAERNAPWQAKQIPPDLPTAFEQWVAHIQQGTTATENIQAAVDLSALMEAANQSAESKCAVRLDSLSR
ncbi:MAG TPA: Gfo/Idh/MocA family oxidoreductase [Herpetosiphonaceae bacterium]|jgi:predicted dehydrogenase|nr:Gfo/Idh/MocA family oxidoreductase [Herpetosiphonaceae bacterium]